MGTPAFRIANSVRLILAMFRLIAGIEADFGKAFLKILKEQYPDQKVDIDPGTIGSKMLAIARRELQNSQDDAQDAIQDFLMYLHSSKFDFRKDTEKGSPGAKTWEQALKNMYSNLRLKAMSGSFKKFKKGEHTDEEKLAHLKFKKGEVQKGGGKYTWDEEKDGKAMKSLEKKLRDEGKDPAAVAPKALKRKNVRDKTLDEAFGKRPEGGGASEGGEARIPTGGEGALGKALDDQAALKEFYDLVDDYLPDLMKSLSKDTLALFKVIFEEDEGTFGADIKANMGQATALKENHAEVWDEFEKKWGPEIKKKHPGADDKEFSKKINLKWSAYVGDLRKRLLDEIWDFMSSHMTPGDFNALKEEFFSDTTPQAVRNLEKEKSSGKADYQRGIDLRKILRARKTGKGEEVQNLEKKLRGELQKDGKDLEKELDAEWAKSGKKMEKDMADEAKKSSSPAAGGQNQAASTISSKRIVPAWMIA